MPDRRGTGPGGHRPILLLHPEPQVDRLDVGQHGLSAGIPACRGRHHAPKPEGCQGLTLRCNGDLQDAVPLVGEQVVGGLDIVQFISVRDHRGEVDTSGLNDADQPPHPLLAAGA